MNDNFISNPSLQPFPSVRPSFVGILQTIKEKVDFEAFQADNGQTDPFYEEICKIITEVLFLNPANELKIAGELLPVLLVQEIFAQLTHEHIEMVADNFGMITNIINNKKAYLRTALYNSVYELESHYTNRVQHDMAEESCK